MTALNPVHTREAQCQDCCRCIRQCPVKAIARDHGSARVDARSCILCGHCVKVCPVGAKVIRADGDRVRDLLARGAKPWVSLAPSWPAEYPDWTPARWQAAARALGFAGVSETALGAQAVIGALVPFLSSRPGLHLSSACPAVVSYIRRYRSDLCGLLVPFPSPLGAHARGLQTWAGGPVPVVFVGPCAAKKHEADADPGRITAALTFGEWEELLGDRDPGPLAGGEFEPWTSGPGAAFALDGGMKVAFDRQAPGAPWRCVGVSGFDAVRRTLDEAAETHARFSEAGETVFLELLSCEGGCTGGPGTFRAPLTPLAGRIRVEGRLTEGRGSLDCGPLEARWVPEPVVAVPVAEAELTRVLERLGKPLDRDQLNCAGCGYETCRQFAEAVVRGRAEADMCVSFNRKWAQKKLSALVRTMPFALVIADANLTILEANGPFVALAGPEAEALAACLPGLEGLALADFVPFVGSFRSVLDDQVPRGGQTFSWGTRHLEGWLFPIDEGRAVGGLFQDVTDARTQQRTVVDQTRAVVRKNVEIVQKIAFLLGENAADTEAILNSILQTFGDRP